MTDIDTFLGATAFDQPFTTSVLHFVGSLVESEGDDHHLRLIDTQNTITQDKYMKAFLFIVNFFI